MKKIGGFIVLSLAVILAVYAALNRHHALAKSRTALISATEKQDRQDADLKMIGAALASASNEIASLKTELGKRRSDSVIVPSPSEAIPPQVAVIEPAEQFEPLVSTQKFGNYQYKVYTFQTLFGADGNALAHNAKFRELRGVYASFTTPDGGKVFNIDDLHPTVLSFLGYDAGLLKRQAQREAATAAVTAANQIKQAEWTQAMRNKAAAEAAAVAYAERNRAVAEAAQRNAQANETLANVARFNALHPAPTPQVNVSVSQAQAQGQ